MNMTDILNDIYDSSINAKAVELAVYKLVSSQGRKSAVNGFEPRGLIGDACNYAKVSAYGTIPKERCN